MRRLLIVWLLFMAIVVAGAPHMVLAQTAPQNSAPEQETASAAVPETVSAEDITTMVAPIALYPDPMLALVLQASTQPLQVVQAQRFLDKRTKDPNLTPNPEWDSSILGLLNYPQVLGSMNEYIDWTEGLGEAVVGQLGDVQDSLLDVRWSAYNTGILASNDRQKVIVEGDIVRIMPADGKMMSVPQYDPMALLEAITPPDEEDAEETATDAPADSDATAEETEPADSADEEQADASDATEPVDTGSSDDAVAATAPAQPEATAAMPTASAYAPYAPPPPMSYSEPETGFWDSAATFAGGAVVGGLLGWGLTEAFDDDYELDDLGRRVVVDGGDLGRRGSVSIEDSTIVVGDHRRQTSDIQKQLRDKQTDLGNRSAAVAERGRTRGAVTPGKLDRNNRALDTTRAGGTAKSKSVRLPGSGTKQAQRSGTAKQKTVKAASNPKQRKQTATAKGHATAKKEGGLGGGIGKRSEVKKEAARGARSRSVAKKGATGGGSKSVVRKAKTEGMAANVSGGRAKVAADRGHKSRGGGGDDGRRKRK